MCEVRLLLVFQLFLRNFYRSIVLQYVALAFRFCQTCWYVIQLSTKETRNRRRLNGSLDSHWGCRCALQKVFIFNQRQKKDISWVVGIHINHRNLEQGGGRAVDNPFSIFNLQAQTSLFHNHPLWGLKCPCARPSQIIPLTRRCAASATTAFYFAKLR